MAEQPVDQWGDQMTGILYLCYAQDEADLPAIWSAITPLSKYRSRAAMESAFRAAAKSMCFHYPNINHSVAVMVLALDFYTKDPDGEGDAINVFLLSDLSPFSGSEAAFLTRRWDVVLGENTFTSFSDTGTILEIQKVVPITS